MFMDLKKRLYISKTILNCKKMFVKCFRNSKNIQRFKNSYWIFKKDMNLKVVPNFKKNVHEFENYSSTSKNNVANYKIFMNWKISSWISKYVYEFEICSHI